MHTESFMWGAIWGGGAVFLSVLIMRMVGG